MMESWNKLKSILVRINNRSQWAELPDDALELIMKRLGLKDYLRLRAVCSTWKATVDKAIANKHCHPLHRLPMVLLKSGIVVPKSSIFSLSTEREFCPKRPLFESNQYCFGSIEGWIIVGEFVDVGSLVISFFNPVTNARVLFPSQLKLPSHTSSRIPYSFQVTKIKASSKPTCSDCIVVCLFPDLYHIEFCRPSNNSWIIIESKKGTGLFFEDVEILDGKLYVITNTYSNSILVYDLQDSSYDDEPPKPKMTIMRPELRPAPESLIEGNRFYLFGGAIHHLAKDEASGELLLIQMRCNSAFEIQHFENLVVAEFVSTPQIEEVQVFKLNLCNKSNHWVKVDSLGDRVVFIGSGNCLVMSRADFDSTEESITSNSIYFAIQFLCTKNPWVSFQLGRFCLTDNSFKYFSVDESSHVDVRYPFWFVPSVW